jgi:hypothetical protein
MPSMKEMLAQKLKNQKLDNSSNQNDELQTTPPPPPPKKTTDVFAAQAEESSIDRSVKFIPLDLIDVEEQIRKNFDPQRIEDLALDFSSSPTKQPAQPITVWKKPDGRYLLNAGENRLRAMKLNRDQIDPVDYASIRASVESGPAPESLVIRNVHRAKENIMRDDLDWIELGVAVAALKKERPDLTQAQISEEFGFKNSSTGISKISKALKFLKEKETNPDVFDSVAAGEMSFNKATIVVKEREKEKKTANQNRDSTAPKKSVEKATTKKEITYSIKESQAKDLCIALRLLADNLGLETIQGIEKLDRKTFIDLINVRLPHILVEAGVED